MNQDSSYDIYDKDYLAYCERKWNNISESSKLIIENLVEIIQSHGAICTKYDFISSLNI